MSENKMLEFNITEIHNSYGESMDVAMSKDEQYIIFPFLDTKYILTKMSSYEANDIMTPDNSRDFRRLGGFASLEDVINGLNYEQLGYVEAYFTNKPVKMPFEEFRDYYAFCHGFDDYKDLRQQGYFMGNGYDISIPNKETREAGLYFGSYEEPAENKEKNSINNITNEER